MVTVTEILITQCCKVGNVYCYLLSQMKIKIDYCPRFNVSCLIEPLLFIRMSYFYHLIIITNNFFTKDYWLPFSMCIVKL